MKLIYFVCIFAASLAYEKATCGEYEMAEDMCIHFSCTSESTGSCLSLPTSYFPSYFTSFRASFRFISDYTFRLRVKIFAYYHCEMPIFDIDFFTHKPLLRNSTVFEGGTYVDNVFSRVEMTPLIDDIEYNLDLDCKKPIPANITFNVSSLNVEEQMCMFDMGSVPYDLFNVIRMISDYSFPIDVRWSDDKILELSNEDVELLTTYLPFTSLNLTRVGDTRCVALNDGSVYE